MERKKYLEKILTHAKQAETPPRIGFSGHSARMVDSQKKKKKKGTGITRLSDANPHTERSGAPPRAPTHPPGSTWPR